MKGRGGGQAAGEERTPPGAEASALMVAPLSALPQTWWEGAPAPQAPAAVPRGMCWNPHICHRTHQCHGHSSQDMGKDRALHITLWA